ncbi:WxL domain-containing protein [Bacillus shivajii]|uniref:WxL domain-containing protein n=1 Tax=Bacillus shivajii TaxID=1983719 RepID=UPI001CF9DEA3|nr:WxL domain-containing protein [Bacillus shivajii]UCZ52147.1 WxL domain-containing protein [Bacillus shivajii]
MKKIVTVLSILTISLGLFANPSLASEGSTSGNAEVTGGQLSIEVPNATTFAGVTLDGTVQTTTASLDSLKIVDPTGTGAGWNVQVSASPIQKDDGTHTLPKESLNLAAPSSVIAGTGSSSAEYVTPKGGSLDVPVNVLSAAVDEGKGTFTAAFPTDALSLTLSPDTALAGQYETMFSWNLTAGPTQ